MNDMRMFSLFDDSNFDAYDRQRYPEVLRAGLSRNGLDLEDVLAVTHDIQGLWAICKQGVFRSDLVGWFRKRIETYDLIRYSDIAEARVESVFRPEGAKIVLYDNSEKKFAQIEFTPSGGRSSTTSEDEVAQCRRILQIMQGARRTAGAD